MIALLWIAATIRFDKVGASFLFIRNLYSHDQYFHGASKNRWVIRCSDNHLESINGRRKKKNKYDAYSKYKLDKDPLDKLIDESLAKQKTIEEKRVLARNPVQNIIVHDNILRNAQSTKFSQNGLLDPLDPSTFGFVQLGRIVGAHGVHGSIKIYADTEFPERLCEPGIRHMKAPNRRSPRKVYLMEGKQISRNEYLLRLDGVNDRDTAMKLRDHILYSRVEERPKLLSDDEYLVSDLVGMHVMLLQKDGQRHDPQISPNIGKISGIVLAEEMCSISGLGNDLLEVLLPEKRWEASKWREHFVLVPFVPAICPVVDLENKVIYIDPPTGLLDLSYAHEENRAIKGFLPGSAE